MLLRLFNAPFLLVLVIVGIALQSSLFYSKPFYYLRPDTVLLLTIWCSLRRHFIEGGVLTLCFAELAEIHSSAPQGMYLLTYMVIYCGVRASKRFFVLPSLVAYAVVAACGSMISQCILFFILILLGAGANQWQHLVKFLWINAVVQAVFSRWLFPVLERFDFLTLGHHQIIDSDWELKT